MNYVGIDLGTTNSAICSYDGVTLHLYKSPEQHDVTPSAIFIDKRGNKQVGLRAYNNSSKNPDNSATLFKRLMGTSTPIKLSAVNLTLTPEECSAEVLRALFGYLPEEIRNDANLGTVITVPAAFNQMQKDATMSAAEMADIGKVALMQEPVAAIMSVMRQRKADGVFLVYDLGGGTLDIAIAESISGRVSLLAHGGIAMCGGRDFDRILVDNVVKPWLMSKFQLPEDITVDPRFRPLIRMATFAAERAKIELYQKGQTVISLPEAELGVQDLAGEEIYLDIEIDRAAFDELIAEKTVESIQAARDTLNKAGLSPHDVERIVFVGGPTHYKPLREKVAFELGISSSTEVNPMTAVAEGAAVFAESIDWSSQSRGRKSTRGAVSAGGSLELSFVFSARTPDSRTKFVAKLGKKAVDGAAFQIDSLDTGWQSGRIALNDGASAELPLPKPGDNTFKVWIFDAQGGPISLAQDKIVITRTAASIDAIPASHSISVAAKEKMGGPATLVVLVKEGEQLPKKGQIKFRAEKALRAGSAGSIDFQLWEGEIREPITHNIPIGTLTIRGKDFEVGEIKAGEELICDYEMQDSGRIVMEVSIPSIGGSFGSGRSFYSKVKDQIDYSDAAKLIEKEAEEIAGKIEEIASKIDDIRVDQAHEKLDSAQSLKSDEHDPETAKKAMESLHEAKRLLAAARKDHLKEIRQMELDKVAEFFEKAVRKYARSSELTAFNNLAKTTQRAIDENSADFEVHLDDLRGRNFSILWRQDWFVVDRFKGLAEASYLFPDANEHAELVAAGSEALKANDVDRLRNVVAQLESVRMASVGEDEMMADINIIKG